MNDDLMAPAQAIIEWCDAIITAPAQNLTEKQVTNLQRIHHCAGTFTLLVAERAAEIARLHAGEINRNLLHELRNLLNCMIGYSDMMLTGFDGDLPEGATGYLRQIFEAAHALNTTLDRLALAAQNHPPEQ
jgi:signal transduction histidine kinase